MRTTRCAWALSLALATAPVAAQPTLEGVALVPDASGVTLTIPLTVEPALLVLEEPHRLVVDLPAISGLPGAPGIHREKIDRWGIHELRTSQYRPGPTDPITRIVIELDASPRWTTDTTAEGIRIALAVSPAPSGSPLVIGRVPPGILSPGPATADSEPTTADLEPTPADSGPATADRQPTPLDQALLAPDPERANADETERPGVGVDDADTIARDHDRQIENLLNPKDEIVDARQKRLWSRRAAELLAMARVRWAAGDYREGLESLIRIFEYYPGSESDTEAHLLAARMYCELHFAEDALPHLKAAIEDPSVPESVVRSVTDIAAGCPCPPTAWSALSGIHEKARRRLGDDAVSALGARVGILLAEAGEDIPRALELLAAAVSEDPDAPEAAVLHRALGLCHEHEGKLVQAARAYLFAARLLVGQDRDGSLSLRLRAADAYFRQGDLERAAEQYNLVAGAAESPPDLRSWALFQRGNCYYRTRRYKMAAEMYGALREAYPTSFWAEQAEVRLAVIRSSGLAGGR